MILILFQHRGKLWIDLCDGIFDERVVIKFAGAHQTEAGIVPRISALIAGIEAVVLKIKSFASDSLLLVVTLFRLENRRLKHLRKRKFPLLRREGFRIYLINLFHIPKSGSNLNGSNIFHRLLQFECEYSYWTCEDTAFFSINLSSNFICIELFNTFVRSFSIHIQNRFLSSFNNEYVWYKAKGRSAY